MNKLPSLLIAALLVCFVTGCQTYTLPKPEISVQHPTAELNRLKKFYVVRDEEKGAQDEKHLRGLHAVQNVLTDNGMQATSGLLSAMPVDTEYKVVIHDKWFWDTYWYLLSLDIKFYDVHSGRLLASGYSRRAPPPIRRSPETMANEVFDAIFPVADDAINH
jgi:hypothetical protein